MPEETEARREWTKFAIFAAILLGTVLVIWLAAPTIFDRVVPAILGQPAGEPSTVFMPTTGSDPATAEEGSAEEEGEIESPPAEEPSSDDVLLESEPAVVEEPAPDSPPAAAADTEVESGYPAPVEETVEPAASAVLIQPRTHVVQPGESLTTISEQYGVTIDDLLLVNQLNNANLIQAGMELLIPVSLNE